MNDVREKFAAVGAVPLGSSPDEFARKTIARLKLEARRLLDDPAAYQQMAQAVNPYGDGQAAGRIVQALLRRAGLAEG